MDDSFFLRAGWLMDGCGSAPERNVLITAESGMISRLSPFGPDDAGNFGREGRAAQFFDFSGFTVLPGLVDAHAHLLWSGTSDPETRKTQVEPDEDFARAAILRHVRDQLEHGVRAVRDGGDRLGLCGRFRESHEGTLAVMAAGRAWHKKGRYGSLIGRAVPEGMTLGRAITELGEPCDHVKVVQSGLNSLSVFGKPSKAQFSLAELKDAVAAAKCIGLPVMAHANGPEAVEIAIKAGCASIEHGFFMGRENLRRLADSDCVWVPTSVTMTGYSESLPAGCQETGVALKMLYHQLDQISFALSLGAKVAVGTDSGCQGVFHGASVAREMENLMRAGFSAERAVKAATSEGARLLGLENAGEIKKGREATLLAIPGPPENLVESLKTPSAFFIKGRMILG